MCANLFALDFSSIKERDTKKSVVKNLGRPFKTVTSADPKKIKPNYSFLIPESSSTYCSVSGMDIDEWDEGKYSFEITELE